ncbi:MAG: hypothetical protein RIC55_24235 [Pirellulaceae bacterium]
MSTVFCKVDDKFVPIYRVMWIADVPHFCGEEDCLREGQYEIRLEQDESVWASREERDSALSAVESWVQGRDSEEDWA